MANAVAVDVFAVVDLLIDGVVVAGLFGLVSAVVAVLA